MLPSTSGEPRFVVLNELFKETNSYNFNQALDYAKQFNDLAQSSGDSVKMVQGGRMRAYSLMDLGHNEEAVVVLTDVLGIARRNQNKYPELKKQIKFILNNAGLANMYLGNYDKALDLHYQSLTIREEEGDRKAIRTALNNIGLVFFNLKDYDRSIQYYLKAIKTSEELKDFTHQERVYINLGLAENQLGKYNEAIDFFNEGFKICKDNCDDNIIKEGLEGLGYAYQANRNYEKAKENFLKSLTISRRQNDSRYSSENLFSLGKIEIELGNEKQGLIYLNEAESLVEAANLAEGKLSVYKELANYYGQRNDYKKSLRYQNKYTSFKDSIYSDKLIKNITKVQTNYDQRENIKTIAEKDQVLALQKEVIVRQQRQYFFIVAIACLIVALASISFYYSRRQQRANKEISKAKNLIQEQNERLESHNRQLEDKVKDRTGDLLLSNNALQKLNDELDYFIYKSSHDIRGPLATLKGMCNIALMDLKDPVALNYFKKFDITTDKLNVILTRLQMVNYVTHSRLKPEPIDFKTIVEETIEFEKRKDAIEHFSFHHEIEPGCEIISDEFLVRTIVENLIDNAVKFRKASDRIRPHVNIKLTREGGLVKVLVQDNGIGIGSEYAHDLFKMFVRASEQSEIGGVGLYLIKLAIDKAGGDVSLIQSGPEGSTFQVLFPLDINEVIDARNKNEKKLVDMMMKQREQPTTPVS
ncbi:MAG TPA: tetratricopeptide repeat-containing sensor histidine kinase [Cyclobacteriaceae bacterium]|nr:tetratricopeptide repeat-containing sensor histidine kinase [Cyclobacteriaceae bacterium]